MTKEAATNLYKTFKSQRPHEFKNTWIGRLDILHRLLLEMFEALMEEEDEH